MTIYVEVTVVNMPITLDIKIEKRAPEAHYWGEGFRLCDGKELEDIEDWDGWEGALFRLCETCRAIYEDDQEL